MHGCADWILSSLLVSAYLIHVYALSEYTIVSSSVYGKMLKRTFIYLILNWLHYMYQFLSASLTYSNITQEQEITVAGNTNTLTMLCDSVEVL